MADFILSGISPEIVSDVEGSLLLSGELNYLMLSVPKDSRLDGTNRLPSKTISLDCTLVGD